QDTRSVLWTADDIRRDGSPVWRTVRVYPTEAECRTEGRARARKIVNDIAPEIKSAGHRAEIVKYGITGRIVIVRAGTFRRMDFDKPGSMMEFTASCWPVVVTPEPMLQGESDTAANSSVLLDSPPAIPIEVPMRRIGLAVVLAL